MGCCLCVRGTRATRPDLPGPAGHETWSGRVVVPEAYRVRTATIDDTALRAITPAQVADLAAFMKHVVASVEIVETCEKSPLCSQRLTWENLEMYSVCTYFVKPLTDPHKCCFVDLVADSEAQRPTWFVSHAWSTPFSQTISMLEFHMQCRGLPGSTPYWICTFANNQHDLGELGGEVLESPFARAILQGGCVGTLLLVDEKCTPMTRVWCVLEVYVTCVLAEGRRFDVAAMIPEGRYAYREEFIKPGPALRMDLGGGEHKSYAKPVKGWFPGTVATAGVAVAVENAEAAREDDRLGILRILAGREYQAADPAASCGGYDAVNEAIHALFRGPALRALAFDGEVDDLTRLAHRCSADELNDQDPDGATPLYAAASFGKEGCVETLLARRAEVDLASKKGATPLHMAALKGNARCVELLLAAGAVANYARDDGRTPLIAAAMSGSTLTNNINRGDAHTVDHEKCVGLLLAAHALVDQAANDGGTALDVASRVGHAAVYAVLRAHGARS